MSAKREFLFVRDERTCALMPRAGRRPRSNSMIILETERLTLRRITTDDAPFLLRLLNEPSFIENIGDRNVRTIEDACQYALNGPIASYKKHGFGLYLVELKKTREAIGICGLVKREALQHPDIGYAFLPAYWRQGYAWESTRAVKQHAFDVLGIERLLAIVSPANATSIKVLEKIGLSFERMVRMADDAPEICLYSSEQ